MAYESEVKDLAEANAVLVLDRMHPLLNVREITRRWDIVKDKRAQLDKVFLDKFTSALNTDAIDADIAIYSVTNPQASDETIPGTFRCVENRMGKKFEPAGLYQVLRGGFSEDTDEVDARIASTTGNTLTKNLSVTRFWPSINPVKLDDLVNGLKTTATVTNPTIMGEELTGTFAVSGVTGDIAEGDGAGLVYQTLTQISNVANSTELAALPYIINPLDNTILNLFGLNEGERDDIAVTFTNINPTSANRTVCMDTITDSQLVTIFAAIPAAAFGWSYLSRHWKDQEDNTAQFTVVLQKATWDAQLSGARDMQVRTPQTGLGISRALLATGLDKAQAESDYETIVAGMDQAAWANGTYYGYGDYVTDGGKDYICIIPHTAGTFATDLTALKWIEGAYLLQSKELGERSGGEFVLNMSEAPAFEGVLATDAHVEDVSPAVAGSRAQALRVWYRRSATARAALEGGIAASPFTHDSITYTHKSLRIVDHHDGAFTLRQLGFVPTIRIHGSQSEIPDDAEILLSADWGSFRISSGAPIYALRIKHVFAKTFASATHAWNYAQTGGGDNIYDENGVLHTGDGYVRERNGKWVGHCVQYRATFSAASGA